MTAPWDKPGRDACGQAQDMTWVEVTKRGWAAIRDALNGDPEGRCAFRVGLEQVGYEDNIHRITLARDQVEGPEEVHESYKPGETWEVDWNRRRGLVEPMQGPGHSFVDGYYSEVQVKVSRRFDRKVAELVVDARDDGELLFSMPHRVEGVVCAEDEFRFLDAPEQPPYKSGMGKDKFKAWLDKGRLYSHYRSPRQWARDIHEELVDTLESEIESTKDMLSRLKGEAGLERVLKCPNKRDLYHCGVEIPDLNLIYKLLLKDEDDAERERKKKAAEADGEGGE